LKENLHSWSTGSSVQSEKLTGCIYRVPGERASCKREDQISTDFASLVSPSKGGARLSFQQAGALQALEVHRWKDRQSLHRCERLAPGLLPPLRANGLRFAEQ
jgi:hypothetical protein